MVLRRDTPGGLREQTQRTLEQLSRSGREGATPDVLGITATQLERLVFRRLVDRLPPRSPGASYRYRISEQGALFLIPRE